MSSSSYTHGCGLPHLRELASRTAAREAAFLMPHLRPGMSMLDCGCGTGSITLGLAERVAPGQVMGVDREPGLIDLARAAAADQGVTNVRFEVGDAYTLPFEDTSFDVAFENALLSMLVTQSGPFARSAAFSSRVARWAFAILITAPVSSRHLRHCGKSLSPSIFASASMLGRVRRMPAINGRPSAKRGFVRSEGSATAVSWGTRTALAEFKLVWEERCRQPALVETVLGRIEEERWNALVDELPAWCDQPDAFGLAVYCEAIGWLE